MGQRFSTPGYIKTVVIAALVTSVFLLLGATPANAAPPPEFERTEIVGGLSQPTAFRFLPDGRILIAEKGGAIKVYANGQVQSEPLITLAVLQTSQNDERGLLGIEPDPNFAQNGWLYVSYTNAQGYDQLSRITVEGDTVNPASEVLLLASDQPSNIFHHGGEVRFGPDGKLYWAMGMNTLNENSQNLSNVHGKILRLNKDGSAPPDNPFINTPGAVKQIWAYGLRNPFRFTFTPNGKLITGDVGGSEWEELNTVQKGGNYGWPLAEGDCGNCPYINPIYTYQHTPPPAEAGSITSTMVYTGSTFPAEYQNKLFIADYTLGWIKYLEFDPEYSSFISEHMFDPAAGTPVQLEQGPDGNIYQMNIYPGALYKIAPSGGNRAPNVSTTADPVAGLAPLEVNFSSEGTADPDGDPLTYRWDFGDDTTSTEANPTKTYTENGTYDVILTASDGTETATATVRVTVGNRLPEATIAAPLNDSKYNAGDVINFSGHATDPEDGQLPDSAYSWKIVFHHANHTHPFRDDIRGQSGSVTLSTSPDNIPTTWYRLHLTVTDSGGLKDSTYVDIRPNTVNLTWQANYPDAAFTIDGIPHTGSHTEEAVAGVKRALGALSPQYVEGAQYHFNNWSDGSAQNHTITTPAQDTTYTVTYDKLHQPPAPWVSEDIGSPSVAGYSAYDNGEFTIHGAGGDIWGPTDEFHYVHQPFSGDGEIIARATAQDSTDDWAKSGIMIKESTAKGAKYALLAVTPANGITFQHDFNGESGRADYEFPVWLRLTRSGDTFTAYRSTDGETWTQVGQTTIDMATNATAGLAVTSHKYDTLNKSVFDNVSVMPTQAWTNEDVGQPRLAGSAQYENDVYTVKGAGDDIWGSADQFHYVHQPLSDDGEIVARVTSQTDTNDWAKAGVMIKGSTTAGSPYALMAVSPGAGVNFQHGFNSSTGGGNYTFPNAWLKLVRVGSVITGYTSADGETWTQVGSATIPMEASATVGLFVTSHDGSALSTATFDNIKITNTADTQALPAPWEANDVGAPKLAGSSAFSGGLFTLNGAGDDIWGDSDQFYFVHQTLSGDGEIIARTRSQDTDTDGWAKSGIMIKDSTAAGSPYALLAVTPEHGVTFQHNFNSEGAVDQPYTFPNAWLKLVRSSNVIHAYTSSDGTNWTEVGSTTVAIRAEARVGLFVTSHNGSMLNTSTFDNVSVTP